MRAAIIGCGSIAGVHAECIKSMPEHELTAFVDINIKAADKFAEKYNGKAYASLNDMLNAENIDIVHICTPHHLHVPMAVRFIEDGRHVFIEKPAAINAGQWNELRKAEKMADGKSRIGFCFQNRYHPCIKRVMEMLVSGITGRISGVRGYLTWSRNEAYYKDSGWRGLLGMEGGGALINQAIHTLDLMDYIIGKKAESIDAVTANHHLKGIIEVEDAVSAYISYKDVSACLYACTAYVSNPPPIIELYCENMRIRIEEMDITIFEEDKRRTISMEARKGYGKDWWGIGHEDCIKDFYNCILSGKRFINDVDGVEEITALVLGAYESAITRKTINLN